VDVDIARVHAINNGRCYIHEPGLADMLHDVISKGALKATTNAVEAVKESEAVIIAVPTPLKNDLLIELDYLKSALEAIKMGLHKGLLVVIESTVPPRVTSKFAKPLLKDSGLKVEEDFYLAHVPERIAPRRAIEELLNIPRIVGGIGPKSTEKAVELYSKINPRLLTIDATTAEFVKLIKNTYRDLNIAYANLLALIADRIGVDVYEAIRLANTHPRVNIHMPGAGVGGPCLTKEPYILASITLEFWGTELIKLARKINEYMPEHTVNIVEKALIDAGLNMKDTRIAVLGSAYKGGVDDTRESPAKYIVKELLNRGSRVTVYDPYAGESFGSLMKALCRRTVTQPLR
jgi:UDP-N-acetyl-D-mannosaminuronic acid dehydrogenase